MKKIILIFSGLALVFQIGCTEETINQIVESGFPEQLTPYETFFDLAVFNQRRDALMTEIPDGSIVIITTNDIYLRNGDVDYDFRPASLFYYLTGFEEPNAAAVITKLNQGAAASRLIMFVEHREGAAVDWLGPVVGPEGAIQQFGADEAYTIDEFSSRVPSIISSGNYNRFYANLDDNESFRQTISNLDLSISPVDGLEDIIDRHRSIKSQIEINAIQRANDISVQAFKTLMERLEPGMFEYEAASIMDLVRGINGCPRNAYGTIVASGPNINTLHYQAGERQMQSGDLVMIDFGAEYSYYAADVTRTLPVNGTFTQQQRDVYEIVLEMHKAVIEAAAPGVSYYDLYWMNVEMMMDGLIEKGIITGNRDEIISSGQYRQYIPAGLGHPVGLDVHDPFPREDNGDKILRENMIIAFEPHLYLYDGDQTIDPVYWNVSARIEDDVLITSGGHLNLTGDLPYEIAEIVAIMNQ